MKRRKPQPRKPSDLTPADFARMNRAIDDLVVRASERIRYSRSRRAFTVTFTPSEVQDVRAALRLRAEAHEDNEETQQARRWRLLLAKLGEKE